MRKLIVLVIILLVFLGFWSFVYTYLPVVSQRIAGIGTIQPRQTVKVVTEESVVISDVKKVGPSVVTVEELASPQAQTSPFQFGPFQIYGLPQQQQSQQSSQPSAIGSGFIISSSGLIATNKHVVADVGATYDVITSNNKKYTVQQVYRDPLNDIAFLKINPNDNAGNPLPAVELGSSSNLQGGQFVVAIGTALGEFRNTVTTGVISGLGRSITAGDQFQGYVENLSNVIQTDAAINPGNSGGPLVNDSGQVIGINTAIAQNGQNVGFSLPVNILKDSLNNFNQHGQFYRPFLGVSYNMISKNVALLNDVPEGAYVQSVVSGSPADKAGVQQGDIIVKFDGQQITATSTSLATLIGNKKVGDTVDLTVWRNGKTIDIKATLASAPTQ